ncbi:MAG: serine/threonine protein kinase [Planctomycetales bacterium]|nr:serine/threonine protein kinase [Planctomycetales bacterium]
METSIDRVEAIFAGALEQVSEEARNKFLDHACENDPGLRQQVSELIENHFLASDFLKLPSLVESPTHGEKPGDSIGRYKLLEVLGEGGFGIVFVAEQQLPVRRTVALKVLKPGMDTSQVVKRFEIERQALALMEHPGIARVIDGGVTIAGRPYFVMELVKGIPITKFCDDNNLPIRERLSLFVDVCLAVQHAHQRGIIHRDLKPANILVSEFDGHPKIKVIDFGIAKILDQSVGSFTLVTNPRAITGTLEYMSPEQTKLGEMDIDTRTDIYSLGVVLYEMLTGSTPLTSERLKAASLTEALQLICESDAPPPSARLRESIGVLEKISAHRRRDPSHLIKEVRGELDWITQKCLEKERGRRYATANSLSRDVNCYLGGDPVEACPPSRWYLLNKFSKRYWPALTAASAFLLLLIFSLTGLTLAYISVNREREQKEQALEAEGMRRRQTRAALDAMSSQVIEGWLTKQTAILPEHKQFLEQALQYYTEFAADVAQDQESRASTAHALGRLGSIHNLLGQTTDAEQTWCISRDMYKALSVEFPETPEYQRGLAESLASLGAIYLQTGRYDESKAARDQNVEIRRKLVADYPDVAEYNFSFSVAIARQGLWMKNTGDHAGAEDAFQTAINLQRRLVADFPEVLTYKEDLAQNCMNLGNLFSITNRNSDAEESLLEATKLYQQLASQFPNEQSFISAHANALNSLGNVLRDTERFDDAEQIYGESLRIRKRIAADFPSVPDHARSLAQTLNNLGILYKNSNRLPESIEHYQHALAIFKKLAIDYPAVADHQNELAGAMVNLGRLHLIANDAQAAVQLLIEAEPFHHSALTINPTSYVYRVFYRNNRWRLAEAQLKLSDHISAAAAAQQFLDSATDPPRDSYTAATLFAGCLPIVEQDSQLSPEAKVRMKTDYTARALSALRQAVELNADEITNIDTDNALAPLRSNEDFQSLLERVQP